MARLHGASHVSRSHKPTRIDGRDNRCGVYHRGAQLVLNWMSNTTSIYDGKARSTLLFFLEGAAFDAHVLYLAILLMQFLD